MKREKARNLRAIIAWSLLMLLTYGCNSGRPSNTDEGINVSIVELIANPERFQHKRVVVVGFLALQFEHSALYLHKEDFDSGITKNGIWLSLAPEVFNASSNYSGSVVALDGTFEMSKADPLEL